jgi:hypothetical protein
MSGLVEVRLGRTLSENDQVGQDDLIQIKGLFEHAGQKETLHPHSLQNRGFEAGFLSYETDYSSLDSVLLKPKSASSPNDAMPPPASEE